MLPVPESMPPANEPVLIGDWLVDPRDDSIARGTERVKLEPRTMRLLMRLAQSPGQVVSQDELLESVWSGVVVGTASVYQSMSQLRKVFGDTDDPPRYIETVARKGYRLLAKVSAAPPTTVPEPTDPAPPAASGTAPAEPEPGNRRARWAALVLVSLLVVAGASWWMFGRETAPPIPPSIVVLPFNDLTPGKTEQAFCDGLTEETSNWLAQLPTLRVVARTSAFLYRDRSVDVRAIGKDLKTTHLLEGSLRRSGNHVRITVQLIDTNTGFHVWSKSYDKEADDVLEVQEDIARKVADNLELRVTAETDSRFAGRRSKSAIAYERYVLARSHSARQDGESLARAIDLYREALKADPSFALAKVWLAHALISERYYSQKPIEELAPEIEALLADVQKTAGDLVDLYVVRGQFHIEMRQREPAMRDLQYALKLNPNSSSAASKLGFYFLTMGQPRDALTYYTIASSLDPRVASFYGSRCLALSELAAYDLAEAACERARALKPESPVVYTFSGQLAEARGDIEGALKWSDAAQKNGSNIAAVQNDRARWLVVLGMMADAAEVYGRALAENPAATRRNAGLTIAGSMAAIDTGGAAGLHRFIQENGLADTTDHGPLFELADAALMVNDARLADEYVKRALASPNLATEDLASPWQASGGHSYLLIIAATLRANGDEAGANKRLEELGALLDRLVAAGVQTHGLYGLKAEYAAMSGRADEAMVELQRAVQMGWRAAWHAEKQPYFQSLRTRADYRELIAGVSARNAATAATLRPRLLN